MSFHNKKCIVLGADGYLGRHLVHFLTKSSNIVTAFGLTPEAFSTGVPYRIVDIAHAPNLLNIDWDVDLVFMFAGLTGTHAGFERAEQFFQVNEIGLVHVLEAIRRSGFKPRVVFPSTRLVYKGSEYALCEDAPCAPKTVYAINKLACEHLLRAYSNNFDVDHTIYRICVPYGNMIGSNYSYGTIGAFINQAANNRMIKLYGDGSLRRTFTHVEDLCDQILRTCLHDISRNQTYNTSGEDISLGHVAQVIADKLGATLQFTEFPEKDWLFESGSTVFDASKLQKNFSLNLKHTMLTWVEEIVLENIFPSIKQPSV